CAALSSDYAYIENSRTINKAARVVRAALLPLLKGPVPLNASGQLLAQNVGDMESRGLSALQQAMSRNGEISEADVYINPDQDVATTGIVAVQFSIVPVGVAREITATIGFVKSIS
ncbi:MAG: DUF2586 domain-containing protein, partial [Pontibacter sp.]|nr:DUF2586 domain-containing protein [Pontibacter sp.]